MTAKIDIEVEKVKLATADRKDLEQLERSNRPKATPNMRQRHALVIAELHRRDLVELQNFHK